MTAAMSPTSRKSIIAPVTRAELLIGLLLDHGGQPVLSLQLLAHGLVGWPHARADQRPVVIEPEVEQVIEIDGLMRAMEIADAEMHDTGESDRPGCTSAPLPCQTGRHRRRGQVRWA